MARHRGSMFPIPSSLCAEVPRQTFVAITQALDHWARACPDRLVFAYLDDGERESGRLTFVQLQQASWRIANFLADYLQPGDRLLLLLPPCLEYIPAFMGCLYSGVIAVPLYAPSPRRPDPRLASVVADCEPIAILSNRPTLARCSKAIGSIPALAQVRQLAVEDGLTGVSPLRTAPPLPRPDDLAFLQYTSGSTTDPRGVCVTHGNIIANEAMLQQAMGVDQDDRFISWLPLHHDMGMIGETLQAIFAGCAGIKMPPATFLQHPRRLLAAVTRYRGTCMGGPNFSFDLCVARTTEADRQAFDLSSLSVTYCGAEPIRPLTLRSFAQAFAPCGFDPGSLLPCYGLAEATLFVSGGPGRRGSGMSTVHLKASALEQHRIEPAHDYNQDHRELTCCGTIAPGSEVEIVDPNTRARQTAGQVGEVWVSGPHVARQYWRRPDASASLLNATIAEVGGSYLRTGDLGFVRDGCIFIAGRIKDLLIIRGRNIYPQDVEFIARGSHPIFQSCAGAAFDIDAPGNESVVLVHEVSRGASPTEIEAARKAARVAIAEALELPVHSLHLVRWGSIPRTSSGKVRRSATRTAFLEGRLIDVADAQAFDTLKEGG